MPVEINELVLRAKVSDSSTKNQNTGDTSGTCVDEAALKPIEKSVKKVMDILNRKNER